MICGFLVTPCGVLQSVDCGPIDAGNGFCCYVVTETVNACVGRPLRLEGHLVTASADGCAEGWSDEESTPAMMALTAEQRTALANAFTCDALLEHASVGTYARFALELLAVGAPAPLVAAAHRAALDEVTHARLCFALAQTYRSAPVRPSPVPFHRTLSVTSDLAELAAETAREGCIGETLAAIVAAEQLMGATDPAVRRALAVIARDEARHAELAWRTVVWALTVGGARVHAAVERVFDDVTAHVPKPPADGVTGLEAHGRLSSCALREAMARGVRDVIRPCARAVLEAPDRVEASSALST